MEVREKIPGFPKKKMSEPMGSDAPVPFRLRALSTADRNSSDLVLTGKSKDEPSYHLAEYSITVTPHSEGREDVLRFIIHFL